MVACPGSRGGVPTSLVRGFKGTFQSAQPKILDCHGRHEAQSAERPAEAAYGYDRAALTMGPMRPQRARKHREPWSDVRRRAPEAFAHHELHRKLRSQPLPRMIRHSHTSARNSRRKHRTPPRQPPSLQRFQSKRSTLRGPHGFNNLHRPDTYSRNTLEELRGAPHLTTSIAPGFGSPPTAGIGVG
jgi:hypothetical protein